jgi:hypothetical protein
LFSAAVTDVCFHVKNFHRQDLLLFGIGPSNHRGRELTIRPSYIISAVETVLKLKKNERHIGRYRIAEDFRTTYLHG